MSEDYMARIRAAAAASRAKDETAAEKAAREQSAKEAHFAAFEVVNSVVIPSFQQICDALIKEGRVAEIKEDIREGSAAFANYNIVTLRFRKSAASHVDWNEISVERKPREQNILFSKKTRGATDSFQKVGIGSVPISDITEAYVMDKTTAVVVSSLS